MSALVSGQSSFYLSRCEYVEILVLYPSVYLLQWRNNISLIFMSDVLKSLSHSTKRYELRQLQSHRMAEAGRALWKFSSLTSAQAHSPACPVPCLGGF